VLSEIAVLGYKCSDIYDPGSDRTIFWADPGIGIEWPLANPTLSRKDSSARLLEQFSGIELF
jgi:dTDP-4-dehydrorhamnose 3,5-epimerase